jgi:hypothetical protein
MNVHMKSAIQKISAKLLRTRHLAIALAAAGLLTVFPILAHAQLPPKGVYFFNANPELCTISASLPATLCSNDQPITQGPITVATLTVNVGASGYHKLLIDYSSAGAVSSATSGKALFYLGCSVDGTACVGTQDNSGGSTTLPGYVNVESCDFPSCSAWDESVNHVWFTGSLSPGFHTVVIKAAVGTDVTSPPFGSTGTIFNEARNLVVTVLGN